MPEGKYKVMMMGFLLCLCLAGVASAQPPGMGREGGFIRFGPVLSALDADKNGSLTAPKSTMRPPL